jgi:hypothetical protein
VTSASGVVDENVAAVGEVAAPSSSFGTSRRHVRMYVASSCLPCDEQHNLAQIRSLAPPSGGGEEEDDMGIPHPRRAKGEEINQGGTCALFTVSVLLSGCRIEMTYGSSTGKENEIYNSFRLNFSHGMEKL